MKRLFAALKIEPDADFLESYRDLRHALRPEAIKWVEEHNIHVTLKFMGETEERRIPAISAALAGCAATAQGFEFRLSGLGIFGSSYAPRVVWTGIEPYDKLAALMKAVHSALIPAGFKPDRQNLVPHLTLGRIKFLKDKILFNRSLDRFRSIVSQPVRAEEIILYESVLRREGPVYTALHKFSLA